jgi:hypothetical protein
MAKTTTAPAATGIKKLNLGGIAAKTEKTATEYPVLPDASGDTAKLVDDLINETRELEAIEGSLEIKKAELKSLAQGFYFENMHGKMDIPSSVVAKGTSPEQNVIVTFASRYKVIQDETPIINAIGADRTAQFFRQAFELKVDGDKIPADVAEELIGEITSLFSKYRASDALTAKAVIKPTADFHIARHTSLSVDENLEIETICPIVAMIKTKGRKGK